MTYAEAFAAVCERKLTCSWSLDVVGWHHQDASSVNGARSVVTLEWKLWIAYRDEGLWLAAPSALDLLAHLDAHIADPKGGAFAAALEAVGEPTVSP